MGQNKEVSNIQWEVHLAGIDCCLKCHEGDKDRDETRYFDTPFCQQGEQRDKRHSANNVRDQLKTASHLVLIQELAST